MRLTPDQRFAVHALTVTCLGGGSIMVFPSHIEIGWTLILGGIALSLLIEANQRWPAPLEALAGRFRHSSPAPVTDPFIPLSEAMRRLYEANLHTSLGIAARGLSEGTPEDILTWLTHWSVGRGLEVYGKRRPSDRLELISRDRFRMGGEMNGATRIERDGFDTYEGLSVKGGEFTALIPELSRMDEAIHEGNK